MPWTYVWLSQLRNGGGTTTTESQILKNITNWTTFFSGASAIGAGDLVIYNGILYQNTTGTATSTNPSADSTNWAAVAFFVWERIQSNERVLIPVNHQMAVHGMLILEGQLDLKGTLVIRN